MSASPSQREFDLYCPQCKQTYRVPWNESWACPVNKEHGPIRVSDV